MILEYVFNINNSDIVIHGDRPVSTQKIRLIKRIVTQRLEGTPLQYIFKKAHFSNSEFYVNKNVLVPRTESEMLVNSVSTYFERKCLGPKNYLMLDVGTGSGAIAIAVCKKTKPNLNVLASDISKKALRVAKRNIVSHQLLSRITTVHSNLLANITQAPDIIVANLPYVKEKDYNNLADPKIALVGGKNGYELIFRLLKQIKEKKWEKELKAVFLEIGYNQEKAIKKFATALFPKAKITSENDLAGYNRLVLLRY